MKTLYTAHSTFSAPGVLTRELAYQGRPVTFVRFETLAEAYERGRTNTFIMIRDADNYLWTVSSKELEVTAVCPCGCGN